MTEPIAIVAIITAVGAAGAILFKTIKKSDCWGIHLETRTPPETPNIPNIIISRPPSPANIHTKTEENKIENNIREIEV